MLVLIAWTAPAMSGCAAKKPEQDAASKTGVNTAARDAADAAFAESAKQPPNAKTMYAMARVLVGQGRDRDAAALLNRVVQQHPTFVPAYNELAGIYFRSDRANDALAVLGAGLKRAPADPVLHNNVGMCHLSQKNYERALESFRQAAAAAPDNPAYRANVAVALGLLGRDDEAAQAYDGVVDPEAAEWNVKVLGGARQDRPGAARPAAPPATAAARR